MKKFVSILLTLAILASMATCVLAGADLPTPETGTASGIFKTTINRILGLVQVVGFAFAVGMLIYLGIKYVSSSANEKAELKKGSVNYVIGAIVIASAASIVKLIFNFATSAIS